jgi:hypothetical protein
MVLSALAEGLDASAAERVFGYRQSTITSWLTRAGGHAEIFHERYFRNLHLPHLQFDELRTRLRSATEILWLWLAIDPLTKLFQCFISFLVHNTWRICLSTRCDSAWPLVASRSSPVMASIATSMLSRLTLVSGEK